MHLLVENMKINFVENEEEEENEAPFSLTVGEEKKFIDSSIDSFIIMMMFKQNKKKISFLIFMEGHPGTHDIYFIQRKKTTC